MESRVQTETKVLQFINEQSASSQTLALVISELVFVLEDSPVQLLIEDLRHHDEVRAIAVVDGQQNMKGIVVRRDLSILMLKPYAQDILKQRNVGQTMTTVPIFSINDSIFLIAEQIREAMLMDEVQYFLVDRGGRKFGGIFSTLDILNYMSHLMQQDVALAGRLQKRIVKERELVVGSNFEYVSSSQTAKGVGGDFTSIKKLSKHKWLVSLCDVSGKGIAASVITSVLWGMMSIYDFKGGLKRFIQQLNNYLVTTFQAEKFITGLFVEMHEQTYTLKICDMGHSHLYLFRKNKLHSIEAKDGNLPIGILEDLEPKMHRLNYQPGDILLMITDGLIEQTNPDGNEYGMERIEKVMRDYGESPVEMLHDQIQKDFRKFRRDQILGDDVSMCLIKFGMQELILQPDQ